jgi:hypothetical protein
MIKRLLIVSFTLLISTCLFAETKGGCIGGTYLVQEGSGAQSLWTFSKDGTVQFASSAQSALNFSEGHGAWRQPRSRVAKATILDFTYGPTSSPEEIARVDAQITFSKKCLTMEGSFDLRFFDPDTEDPLDVNSDTGQPVSDTFTGRRVTAQK